MTDRKNIKVPEPLFTRLKEDKGAHRSWPQYFEDQLAADDDADDVDVAERLDAVMNKLEQLEGAQADTVSKSLKLADISNHDVLEQLDTVERAAKEATSAAQSAEQAINEVTER